MWRALTESDLKTGLSGTELSRFRAAALADGQADPIQDVINSVTDYVRGYIAAHKENTLGPDGTLPEKLIRPAVNYLVIEVQTRVAGVVIDPKSARKDARDDAVRLFEQVAKGLFAIEVPEQADDEQHGTPSPSISGRNKMFSKTQQDGI
jgi:hypothetical protein